MKSTLKTIAYLVALLCVLPMLLLYWISRTIRGRAQTLPGFSQAMSILPGTTGVYLRYAFYRCVLDQCERDACISFGTIFSHATAKIGRTVYIGPYCMIGDVTLEEDVLVSAGVSIMNGSQQHGIDRLDLPIREQQGVWPHVTIGRDSWIGDRAIVQADVGKHCVIGSGAVVTKPVPDYAIAVGVPARVIRYRNEQEVQSGELPAEATTGS